MESQPPVIRSTAPTLGYRRRRGRIHRRLISPIPLIWADHPPPDWLSNLMTVAFFAGCIWYQRGLSATEIAGPVAGSLWFLVGLVWVVKLRFALLGPVPPQKQFWRSTRWLTVPVLMLATVISSVFDLPLRVEFLINYPALKRIAAAPHPRQADPVAITHSYTITRIFNRGPRVTLYTGGADGTAYARSGFQWVRDGSSPDVGHIDHLIPMGFGWYAFYDND